MIWLRKTLIGLLALVATAGPAGADDVLFDSPARSEIPCDQNSWGCAWPYLALGSRFPAHASDRRWSWEQLTAWVQDAREQLVEPEVPQPSEGDLPRRIRDALDADWLWWRLGLFGGPGSAVRVGPMVSVNQHRDHERTHVWIDDEVVLGFPAIVLRPPGPGPHPAVLVVHGHNGDAHQAIDSFGGLELAEAGFLVFAPTFRVNGASVVEDAVTRLLLEEGFSLLAVRVYEQLLALRIMRAMPDVDPARIGLLAHSGGTAGANLAVRLAPWVGALVTDNECQYYSEGTAQSDPVAEVLDETFPPLFPIHPAVLRYDDLGIPALRIPYGPKESADELVAFFREWLGAP